MTIAKDNSEKLGEELRVSAEFLAKYNRPGPRYTSYPTAPVWNDAFGPDDLERVHEQSDRAKAPVSLYMHLPFCESLCLFCACNVIIQKDHGVTKPYLGVLKQEIGAGQFACFARAAGGAVSLGRRDADVFVAGGD